MTETDRKAKKTSVRLKKTNSDVLRRWLKQTTAFSSAALKVALPIVAAGMSVSAPVLANPQNGTVVEGSATIVQENPNSLIINQSTDKAVIDWQSFSIDVNQHTHFQQPSSSSHTLNRVTGDQVSRILGRLTANGKITLVNPNGIFFGPNSQVDVAALIAATHNITNSDFMADRFNFTIPGNADATVVNEGLINVQEGGLVALVAPGVGNSGIIQARLGKVVLAAAGGVSIDFYGDNLITFTADSEIASSLTDINGNPLAGIIDMNGSIEANGGTVLLTANTARDILDNAINMDGVIQAQSIDEVDGKIVIGAVGDGIVHVSGTVDASGADAGEKGGTIKILGEKVGLFDNAEIDASGHSGGGEVLIGGNLQGGGEERNAEATYVSSGSEVKADAIDNGDGGKVIVWADEATNYYGHVSVKGGQSGGDGGFVEVSGKEFLNYQGSVDLTSVYGAGGELLLDPQNIEITNTTANITESPAGTFTSNDSGVSTLNVSEITTILNGMGNVTIQTGAAGGEDGDIILSTDIISTTGGVDVMLDFDAHGDIIINNGIVSTGAYIILSLTAGGDIEINDTIDLNGGNFTASGVAFDSTSGTLTDIGSFSLTQTGAVSVGSLSAGGNVSITSGGNITQNNLWDITGTTSLTTSTANDTIVLNNTNNSFGSDVTLSTAGTAGHVTLRSDSNINIQGTVNGNLDVRTDGSIDDGAAGVTVAGTTYLEVLSGGGNIVFDNGLDSTGSVSLNTDTGAVTMTATSAIELAASTSGGNFTVYAADDITQSGALTVGGSTSLETTANNGSISITDENNSFGSSVAFSPNGSGDVYVDFGGSSVSFGSNLINLTFDGDLWLRAGGIINQTGAITVLGQTSIITDAPGASITLDTAANTFTNGIYLETYDSNATISNDSALDIMGGDVGGNLSITTEGYFTQTGGITVAGTSTFEVINSGTGNITLDSSDNYFIGDVTLTPYNTGDVVINGGSHDIDLWATSINGDLTVTAGGNIAQVGGDIDVTGQCRFETYANNGSITLTDSGNTFGTISFETQGTGNVSIFNNSATAIDAASIVGGNLVIETDGNITQSGSLTVGGTSMFDMYSGGLSISLTDSGNSFGDVVTFMNVASSSVQIDGGDDDITISGGPFFSFYITSGGNIYQSGAIEVGDSLYVTTDANNASVYLTDTMNDFTGISINPAIDGTGQFHLHTGPHDFDVSSRINFAYVGETFPGGFFLESGGNITQSAALNLTGPAVFTASAVDFDISLNDPGNSFSDYIAFSTMGTGDVIIDGGANPLVIGTSNVAGNLQVTAGGDITQSGTLYVDGNTLVSTDGGNANILLTNSGNNFDGQFDADANGTGNVSVDFGTGDAILVSDNNGGNFIVVADGNITQTAGSLNVNGLASFTVQDSGSYIDLSSTSNFLNGNVYFETMDGDVDVGCMGSVAIQGASIGGSFSVDSAGSITQNTGPILVGGNSYFETGSPTGHIVLNRNDNSFEGDVYLAPNSTANASISSGNTDLYLAATTIGGDLTVTSVGLISQNGALTVNGLASFSSTGSGNGINLYDGANDFAGGINYSSAMDGHIEIDYGSAAAVLTGGSYGSLFIRAGGNISQTGALDIAGDAFFETDGAGATVILDNGSNQFDGVMGADAPGNIAIDGGPNNLDIGDIYAGGNLIVKAGGEIYQVSGYSISAFSDARFETYDNNGDINIGQDTNEFDGFVTFLTNGSGNVFFDGGIGDLVLDGAISDGDVTLYTDGEISGDIEAASLTINAGSVDLTGTIDGATGLGAANAIEYEGELGAGPYFMNDYQIPATVVEEEDEEQQDAIDQATSVLNQDIVVADAGTTATDGTAADVIDFGTDDAAADGTAVGDDASADGSGDDALGTDDATGDGEDSAAGDEDATGEDGSDEDADTGDEEGSDEDSADEDAGDEEASDDATASEEQSEAEEKANEQVAKAEEILETASLEDAIDFMNKEADMSLSEQKQFIKKLGSEKIVSSLKNSSNKTVVKVAEVLEKTASGGKTQQADLSKMLKKEGFDSKTKLTYLALHQHVVKEARTELFSGALEKLKKNPNAANVFDKGPAGVDNRPPVIKQLHDEVAPTGEVIAVKGKVEDESKFVEVTVNGRWVYVDDDGSFEIDPDVAQGNTSLKLQTVDESGNRTEKVINVRSDFANKAANVRPKGKKVALLMGVNNYDNDDVPGLDTPVTDVTAIGEVLGDMFGYETKVLKNPSKKEIVEALSDMSKDMSSNDRAVIYYAGHGYSFEDSAEGYWLPSDAAVDNVDNWVSTKDVSKFLHRMPAKNIKLIADSCYSGAFTQEQNITANDIVDDSGELLSRRSVMAMSSGGDEPVWDGGADGHSLFAATLINTLKDVKKENKGFDVFSKVRDEIVKEAPQTPQYGVIKSAGYDKGGDYLFEKK